jgi:hypothetical protein
MYKWWEYGVDGDELSMTLNVDNTVVVNEKVGNDENVDLGHRI